MINEETLNRWINTLEEAKHLLEAGETPSSLWFNQLDWLIYDGRRDIESRKFDIPGFVSQAVVDKLNNEIDSLEQEAYSADVEYGNMENEIDRLANQVERLKLRLMDHHLWDEEEEKQ